LPWSSVKDARRFERGLGQGSIWMRGGHRS
jgi:hypothetical protein